MVSTAATPPRCSCGWAFRHLFLSALNYEDLLKLVLTSLNNIICGPIPFGTYIFLDSSTGLKTLNHISQFLDPFIFLPTLPHTSSILSPDHGFQASSRSPPAKVCPVQARPSWYALMLLCFLLNFESMADMRYAYRRVRRRKGLGYHLRSSLSAADLTAIFQSSLVLRFVKVSLQRSSHYFPWRAERTWNNKMLISWFRTNSMIIASRRSELPS